MLIPNGGSNSGGIVLKEVMRKTVVVILNRLLGAVITLQNVLYGLQDGNGTGNPPLEDKLFHNLMAMMEEVLCAIFLDLKKAYNILDRDIFLGILEGCEVGPQAHRLIYMYW